MEKQEDQKLNQAKQHFEKAVKHAHKAFVDLKSHYEEQVKTTHSHMQESLKQKVNELDQAIRELKKTADASIAENKDKLIAAADEVTRTAEKFKQKAQTDFQQLQPKIKEEFNHAINDLQQSAQNIKKILTTAGARK